MFSIRGERVALRLITHADVDTYVAYRSDPTTLEFMDTRVPPVTADVHARVDQIAELGGPADDQWVPLAITRPDGDEMLGDVGVGLRSGGAIAEIGYALRPEFRGHGYAAAAAALVVDHVIEHHGAHRIEAELSTLNVASMRVLESIGMSFESITKLTCCLDGEWEDDLRYAMTADERRLWSGRDRSRPASVELVEVDAGNADLWVNLRTHHSQEQYVAPMLWTYRDALFPDLDDGVVWVPWMRGITADGVPAGFMMTTTSHARQDGSWYLWRLLIDRVHQRRGIGERAVALLVDELRARNVPRLFTSCVEGPGGPRPFYERLGFRPTGAIVDDETELVLEIET